MFDNKLILGVLSFIFSALGLYMIITGFKMPKIKVEETTTGTTTTNQSATRNALIVFGFIFLALGLYAGYVNFFEKDQNELAGKNTGSQFYYF